LSWNEIEDLMWDEMKILIMKEFKEQGMCLMCIVV
jgi:hypothetical protein